MSEKRKIAILGSTGSIGKQALDVIRNHKDKFSVEVLVAGKNSDMLEKQAREFDPNIVIIADDSKYSELSESLKDTDTKVFAGKGSIIDIVQLESVDLVVAAMVGFEGLEPVFKAIESGKPVALANKETLVVAGELIMKLLKKKKSPIIPVDSEHSAIFQSLNGEKINEIKKIILTASGGPFRNTGIDELKNVRPEQALKHPNWNMGKKVSIDSATMMNKGLEIIEARWLFDIPPDRIDVLVHPQSIVHSMVEFIDGSMKAQLGNTDMRLPIQYALSWPFRIKTHVEEISLSEIGTLDFSKPDDNKFPNLKLAYDVLNSGGDAACILNASNEIAVDAFLNNEIKFLNISDINKECLNSLEIKKPESIEDYIDSDKRARKKAKELTKNFRL